MSSDFREKQSAGMHLKIEIQSIRMIFFHIAEFWALQKLELYKWKIDKSRDCVLKY